MNKELAEKVYLFILEEINGWSEEKLAELSPEEIYCDPIFEGLCKLEVKKMNENVCKYCMQSPRKFIEERGIKLNCSKVPVEVLGCSGYELVNRRN